MDSNPNAWPKPAKPSGNRIKTCTRLDECDDWAAAWGFQTGPAWWLLCKLSLIKQEQLSVICFWRHFGWDVSHAVAESVFILARQCLVFIVFHKRPETPHHIRGSKILQMASLNKLMMTIYTRPFMTTHLSPYFGGNTRCKRTEIYCLSPWLGLNCSTKE